MLISKSPVGGAKQLFLCNRWLLLTVLAQEVSSNLWWRQRKFLMDSRDRWVHLVKMSSFLNTYIPVVVKHLLEGLVFFSMVTRLPFFISYLCFPISLYCVSFSNFLVWPINFAVTNCILFTIAMLFTWKEKWLVFTLVFWHSPVAMHRYLICRQLFKYL